ncbi:MAG: YesL family protein [Faecousia sp.]
MFKTDGPIFSALSRILDIILLNVLWMLCCVPVITIGPATCAMYGVCFKMREKKDDSVVAQFFLAFKNNFRQGLPGSLLLIATAAVLYLDYRVVYFDGTFSVPFMKGLFWVVAVAACAYFSWLFPLIAKFENSFRGMLRNARMMTVRHLPITAIITALNLLPWLMLYYMPAFTLQTMLLFWLLMGFALLAYINSLMLYRVFYQYFDPEYIAKLKKAQEELYR